MQDRKVTRTSGERGVVRLSLLKHMLSILGSFTEPSRPLGQHLEIDDPPGRPNHDRLVSSSRWELSKLDVGAWMIWTLVGLRLFSGDSLPTMGAYTAAARQVLLFAAIDRFEGNITWMAAALGISRRSLREQLKAASLYAEEPSTVGAKVAEARPPARPRHRGWSHGDGRADCVSFSAECIGVESGRDDA